VTCTARAAWLLVAALLAGCMSVPKSGERLAGDSLSGRLSVRVDGVGGAEPRSLSAAFELEGDAQIGRLNLATPLGTLLAQARWAPGQVLLVTPQRETKFADLDSLTAEVLGESLPVGAMFDWLRGRPWPGAISVASAPPAEPGFQQLGWVVSLASFDEALVLARRERAPAVTVRAKLDRP
jgi:outer membrane lipoprotein LolB